MIPIGVILGFYVGLFLSPYVGTTHNFEVWFGSVTELILITFTLSFFAYRESRRKKKS